MRAASGTVPAASSAQEASRLDQLLRPRSVAIVGASPHHHSHGNEVLRNLTSLGFGGAIHLVNPAYEAVGDRPCVPTLRDLPDVPDCAVICVRKERAVGLLRDAAELGVGAAVVFASGFAEAESGRSAHDDLVDLYAQTGMPILGPNCLGLVNTWDAVGLYAVPLPQQVERGSVGLISHSGSGCIAVTAAGRLGMSCWLSTGNEIVTGAADYLDFLVSDDRTSVITLILETIRDPEAFAAAADRALVAGKPVVALKLGRSRKGSRALATHTGALAGDADAYDAFFRRHGVITVGDFDELIETAELLAHASDIEPAGGLGIVTMSGGESALNCDIADDFGIELPTLSAATTESLERVLPDFAHAGNPFDLPAVHDTNLYRDGLQIFAADPGISVVAVGLDAPPAMSEQQMRTYQQLAAEVARVAAEAPAGKTFFCYSNVGQGLAPGIRAVCAEGGLPLLQGTRESLRAVGHLFAYARRRRATPYPAAAERVSPSADSGQFREQLAAGRTLSGAAASGLLRAYGLPVVEDVVCTTAESAVAAAERIGFPVAVKLHSDVVHHKTDVGGVVLGIESGAAVAAAFDRIVDAVRVTDPGAAVSVQEMVPAGVEAFIGYRRDPQLGGMLVLGTGGIWTESWRDVAVEALPVDDDALADALSRTRLDGVLRTARGSRIDRDAFLDTAKRVAAIVADLGDVVAEMDLNPVIVLADGCGARVVDALVVGTR